MAGFESGAFCNFNEVAAKAVAGKDVILAVFDTTGADLLAVGGQQALTINRSADSIEVTTKDSTWKSYISGMKEWGIDTDGVYSDGDAAHKALTAAFLNGDLVCIKVINRKTKKAMFGGLCAITDYPLEAPYDDALTFSLSLQGNGALTDLSANTTATQMPKATA